MPIFSRSKGDLKPLPFPVIGSLNGVHMFGAAQDAILKSSLTEHGKIVWKMFEEALTLIVVTDDCANHDKHMTHFLDLVFNAVVLLCGLEDILSLCNRNVERLKKEVKLSLTLVDHILRNGQSDINTSMCDLTRAVDVLYSPDHSHLQPVLDSFTSAAMSPYGCLMVHNRLSLATERWWALPSLEQTLLLLLMSSLPYSNARDIPVFLPIGSPKIAHRLLTFHLLSGVEVAVICGPQPTLTSLQTEVERFWRPNFESIRSLSRLVPRFIPEAIQLDNSVLGFLLINTEQSQTLWTIQPFSDERRFSGNLPNAATRMDVLRSFYKQTVGQLFPLPESLVQDEPTKAHPTEFDLNGEEAAPPVVVSNQANNKDNHDKESSTDSSFNGDQDNPLGKGMLETPLGKHQIAETYQCANNYKCYAIHAPPYQFFVMFACSLPTYAMRSVAHRTFEDLLSQEGMKGGITGGKYKPKG